MSINPEIKHLFFECYVEQEDIIWFFSFMYNGLYRMEKKTLNITFIGRIPGEKIIQSRLYKAAALVENKIVFAPCSAKEIAIYDIDSNMFTKIALKDIEKFSQGINYTDVAKFWALAVYKSDVYIMAHFYPSIIKLNMLNYEVTYINSPMKQLDKIAVTKDNPYLAEGIIEGHLAIFPSCCANAILKFDLKTENYAIEQIPYTGEGFNGVCKNGDNYWFVPRIKGNILKYNSKSHTVLEYGDFPEGLINDNIPFAAPLIYKDKLYIPPVRSSSFLVVDMKNGKMETIKELDLIINGKMSDYARAGDKVKAAKIKNGRLFLFCSRNYQAYIFDIETKCINNFYIDSNGQEIQDYYQTIKLYDKKRYFYYEQKDLKLEQYIRFIKNFSEKGISGRTYYTGGCIHESIKRSLSHI